MPVASWTSSTDRPPRSACCTVTIRPSVGVLRGVQVGAAPAPRSGCGPSQWKVLSLRSIERSAFCRASVKLRPIDIASPTDFIVVVRVVSAAGNFSKANRGTLTTT